MGAYYTDKQNLEQFSRTLNNVRHLMNSFLEDVYKKADEGDKIVTWPNLYTFVRAIGAVFYEDGLVPTLGTCLIAEQQDMGTVKIVSVKHYWLTWREMYIIDVIPVDGKFGISLPSPVFEEGLPKRFKPVPGIYESVWSPTIRMLADNAVNDLSLLLETLVTKTPS